MPSTKSISGNVESSDTSRKAVAANYSLSAGRRALLHGARRPFFRPSEQSIRPPVVTVRSLARPAGPRRRRRSARVHVHPFSLPRRLQLALLDCPEIRCELERRRRVFLAEVASDIMGAGFGLNATARILGMSAGRLCVWVKTYRRSGAAGLRSQSQTALSSRQAPCRFSLFLTL
jgi:hypothetical protein